MQECKQAFEKDLFNKELAQNNNITRVPDKLRYDGSTDRWQRVMQKIPRKANQLFQKRKEGLDKIFEKQRTLISELSELDANLQKKQKDLEVETN
ncbi:5640_t:CDS:2, partial [Acaulospora morrowiae]